MKVLSTRWFCHITPSDSGTCPSFFMAKRFASAPNTPVISVGSILVMSSSWVSIDVGIETPPGGGL